MLKRISKQLSFLVAGIPFTERHYSIRVILHALFFFVVIMCGSLFGAARSEMGERVCWCIAIVAYFNIYYFMLQYSLPVMLLLLGVEPLVFYVVYFVHTKTLEDAMTAMLLFTFTGPVLHLVYTELLYRLRSDLAPKQTTETFTN